MKGYKYYTVIKFRIDGEPEREVIAHGQLNFGTSATYIKNHVADGRPFMMISAIVHRETYVMDDAIFYDNAKKINCEVRKKYE